jgi:hypothetical protein
VNYFQFSHTFAVVLLELFPALLARDIFDLEEPLDKLETEEARETSPNVVDFLLPDLWFFPLLFFFAAAASALFWRSPFLRFTSGSTTFS